ERARPLDVLGARVGKALAERGDDRPFPGAVDDRLVREHGEREARSCRDRAHDQRQRRDRGDSRPGGSRLCPRPRAHRARAACTSGAFVSVDPKRRTLFSLIHVWLSTGPFRTTWPPFLLATTVSSFAIPLLSVDL